MLKNISKVFSANLVNMLISILTAFLLPYFLTVDSYAELKTFTFYVSYLGILQLGFVDGMYIKYGGKKISEISTKVFFDERKTFVLLQIVLAVIALSISLFFQNTIFILLAISVIPINLFFFYRQFFQAVGEFSLFAVTTTMYAAIPFVLNLILMLVFKTQNPVYYCLSTILGYVVIDYYFVFKSKFFENKKGHLNYAVMKENIQVGVFVLFGNLSLNFITALDRWFISIFYDKSAFAFYSFAVSMLNIVNVVISSVSITFYNYLVGNRNEEQIKEIKNILLVVGIIFMTAYFPLKFIVELFIPEYIPSLDVIAISFMSFPFSIVINTLYVNLYKANKNERKYFTIVVGVLVISVIINTIMMQIVDGFISVTIGSLIVYILWYLYSQKDFSYLRSTLKELVFIASSLIIFYLCSRHLNVYSGFLVSLILLIGIMFIFMRSTLIKIISFARGGSK